LHDEPVGVAVVTRHDAVHRGLDKLHERGPGSIDIRHRLWIEPTVSKEPAEDIRAGLPGNGHSANRRSSSTCTGCNVSAWLRCCG
jgi:hypothetical protein